MKIHGVKDNEQYKTTVCRRRQDVILRPLGENGWFVGVPEGWTSYENGYLCPECSKIFDGMKKDFMKSAVN